MIPPHHLQPLAEAVHEAIGRALRDEPVGEPDLRNALLFAHQLIAECARHGIDVTPAELAREGFTVQYSMSAKSGPALDPSAPARVGLPWDPAAHPGPGYRR